MGFLFNHDEEIKKRDEEQVRQLDRGTAPNVSAGDVAQKVKGAIYETGAMGNALLRASAGTDSFGKAAEFRQKRDTLKSEAITQRLTPGGRAMAKGTMLPDDNGDSAFLRNPIGYVAFNGAAQAPMLAISAIPGAAIGRGLMATAKLAKYAGAATTGTTATMGGVLNTGDVLQSVYTELDKMTKKDWSKVPAYLKLVSQGLDYEEASGKLKEDAVAQAGALAFGLGTILNTVGAGQMLAKAGAGKMTKEGFVKGLVKGARDEGLQETAEEGSGNVVTQQTTRFGDDFDWKQALEAAAAGGVLGGIIGGGVGGVTNIGKPKTPKIPVVQPGNAPSATQAAAVTGAPLPPPPPPKTQPTAPAVTVGPPVVAAGAHTPPPGASTKTKSFVKKKPATSVPVTVSAVPDANITAAIQATTPAPVIQAAPEIQPPPPVTQNVTPAPPPIIRKRAQAELAPPPEQAPPPITPVENISIPPAPVEQIPPGSQASRLPGVAPRVLPDLAAQQRYEAELDTAAAAPDMSARGTRYDLGQNAEEVNNPAKHQAWRRRMFKEVQGNEDPLYAKDGDWRKADVIVITDEGTNATVKAGPAIDYQVKRIRSLRELLDCVNAS